MSLFHCTRTYATTNRHRSFAKNINEFFLAKRTFSLEQSVEVEGISRLVINNVNSSLKPGNTTFLGKRI